VKIRGADIKTTCSFATGDDDDQSKIETNVGCQSADFRYGHNLTCFSSLKVEHKMHVKSEDSRLSCDTSRFFLASSTTQISLSILPLARDAIYMLISPPSPPPSHPPIFLLWMFSAPHAVACVYVCLSFTAMMEIALI
jgi:hypothetical protein